MENRKTTEAKAKTQTADNILELKNITKTFLGGKIIANDNVSLNFKRNEVHALVGENGSGKSTLMNIIFGLYKQDQGDIFLNGEKVDMYQPGAAKKYKIGMVHQHFHLVDNFTVLENVILGQEELTKNEESEKLISSYREEEKNSIEKIEELRLKNKKFTNSLYELTLDKIKAVEELEKNRNIRSELKNKRSKISIDKNPDAYNQVDEKIKNRQVKIDANKDTIEKLEKFRSSAKAGDQKQIIKLFDRVEYLKRELKIYDVKLTGLFGTINKKVALERLNLIEAKYNIKLDPYAKISNLAVGQRQMVEILKVLWEDKEVLVFDEPTATLSVNEIKALLKTIKALQEEGKTIIFISHKLKEVKEIANRVSVLRKGTMMGTFNNDSSLQPADIGKLMVGKTIKLEYPERKIEGREILKFENLSYRTSSGFKALDDVTFSVKEGEIFGLAGIEGNGQEEIIKILTDLRKPYKGKIIHNKKVKARVKTQEEIDALTIEDKKKREAALKVIAKKNKNIKPVYEEVYKDKLLTTRKGYKLSGLKRREIMSHVPIDRLKHAVVPIKDLEFNAKITDYDTKFLSKNSKKPGVDKKKLSKFTDDIIKGMNVDGAFNHSVEIRNLSGGNQQKFVVGREIFRDHEIFVAGHPTRGLDISAIDHIYKAMLENSKNKTTILYSLEISELIAVCDRMAIMYKGKIVDIVNPKKVSMDKISRLMIGEVN